MSLHKRAGLFYTRVSPTNIERGVSPTRVNPLLSRWSYTVTSTVPMFPGLSDDWPIRRCNTWLFDRPTNQMPCLVWYKNSKNSKERKDLIIWWNFRYSWKLSKHRVKLNLASEEELQIIIKPFLITKVIHRFSQLKNFFTYKRID